MSEGVPNNSEKRSTPAAGKPLEGLFGEIYPELCELAERWISRKPALTVVDPTMLVHEAYVKLAAHGTLAIKSKTHFFSIAARAMRQILVDFARRRAAAKRGGDQDRVTLSGVMGKDGDPGEAGGSAPMDVVALDAALRKLAELNARHAQVVEMRFFAGMELGEIAMALGVSRRTVDGDWAAARAWLYAELRGARGSGGTRP